MIQYALLILTLSGLGLSWYEPAKAHYHNDVSGFDLDHTHHQIGHYYPGGVFDDADMGDDEEDDEEGDGGEDGEGDDEDESDDQVKKPEKKPTKQKRKDKMEVSLKNFLKMIEAASKKANKRKAGKVPNTMEVRYLPGIPVPVQQVLRAGPPTSTKPGEVYLQSGQNIIHKVPGEGVYVSHPGLTVQAVDPSSLHNMMGFQAPGSQGQVYMQQGPNVINKAPGKGTQLQTIDPSTLRVEKVLAPVDAVVAEPAVRTAQEGYVVQAPAQPVQASPPNPHSWKRSGMKRPESFDDVGGMNLRAAEIIGAQAAMQAAMQAAVAESALGATNSYGNENAGFSFPEPPPDNLRGGPPANMYPGQEAAMYDQRSTQMYTPPQNPAEGQFWQDGRGMYGAYPNQQMADFGMNYVYNPDSGVQRTQFAMHAPPTNSGVQRTKHAMQTPPKNPDVQRKKHAMQTAPMKKKQILKFISPKLRQMAEKAVLDPTVRRVVMEHRLALPKSLQVTLNGNIATGADGMQLQVGKKGIWNKRKVVKEEERKKYNDKRTMKIDREKWKTEQKEKSKAKKSNLKKKDKGKKSKIKKNNNKPTGKPPTKKKNDKATEKPSLSKHIPAIAPKGQKKDLKGKKPPMKKGGQSPKGKTSKKVKKGKQPKPTKKGLKKSKKKAGKGGATKKDAGKGKGKKKSGQKGKQGKKPAKKAEKKKKRQLSSTTAKPKTPKDSDNDDDEDDNKSSFNGKLQTIQ